MTYQVILGARVTECENEASWLELFEDLKKRGLTGVLVVISNGHTGIQKAAEAAFLGASNVSGSLHSGRFEEYSPEMPEKGCRGPEGGLWK